MDYGSAPPNEIGEVGEPRDSEARYSPADCIGIEEKMFAGCRIFGTFRRALLSDQI
jgi:hypothetical protein